MQDYEYKDEGGRFLCKLHHKLRCDECHYVSDLRDENKRYRKALRFYADRTHYELSREAEEADLIEFINDMDRDEGYIARKALEGESEPKELTDPNLEYATDVARKWY